MRIFVVSWFYPPVTTSEALVTYKLLAHSKNEYYLCSASSKNWSYNSNSVLESENIIHYSIDTDDFDEYIEECLKKYKELSKKIKFDAIMTRSMPPESQIVGLKIREIDETIPWIVSLADPIGNNPYETAPLLFHRKKIIRKIYINAPNFCLNKLCKFSRNKYINRLGELNRLQCAVIEKADIVIVPDEEQGRFIIPNENEFLKKCLVIPHSYDKKLYPKDIKRKDKGKIIFSFVGHSDALRSIEPFVRAVKLIKDLNPEVLENIKFRFVGNIPQNIINMIYVYFLQNVISVEKPVNYGESLKIMKESDYLIHIDAYFSMLPYGSIFFAAKIADYMGAKKPIIGLTNVNTPAGKMISSVGGVCVNADPLEIAKTIIGIVHKPLIFNEEYALQYDASQVAKRYDDELIRRIGHEK